MKVLALVAGMLAFGVAQADAATLWSGETHGKVYSSNRLAAGGHSWEGTFNLSVGADGTARGYAVIAYTPEIDLSGSDYALGFIRDVLGTSTAIMGPFASALEQVGVASVMGFQVDFKQAIAIRRARLKGRMANGRLRLDWAKPKGVPYDLEMVLPDSTSRVSSGRAVLHNPFKTGGRTVAPGFVVSTETSADGGTGGYWAAHRVG